MQRLAPHRRLHGLRLQDTREKKIKILPFSFLLAPPMGLRDQLLSKIINFLYSDAMVHAITDGVWQSLEFFWLDGSLFYRAYKWESLGVTWDGYLTAMCLGLVALLSKCTKLRVFVMQIDKYGEGTVSPQPKEPIQAHRYANKRHVENPLQKYIREASVAGLNSEDTFGNLDARMAFNEMVSRALEETLVAYKAAHGLDEIIVDGFVRDGRAGVWHVQGDRMVPMPDETAWCAHSEGDIGLAHWLPRYAHLTSMAYSCDVDLQQVALWVMRRFADAGRRPEELPDIYLQKVVPSVGLSQTFDMKLYYQLVCTVFGHCTSNGSVSHPLEVWALITAASGNDFCAPWCCSIECARGEKDNDGIRASAIYVAYIMHYDYVGALLEPVTEADLLTADGWSVFRLPAYVYPVRAVVSSWKKLMTLARDIQMNRTQMKVAAPYQVLEYEYCEAQVRRMSWAVAYYANAALLGRRMPRGVEMDHRGRSIHGWTVDEETGEVLRSARVPRAPLSVCGVGPREAPTRPPSPPSPGTTASALADLDFLLADE